MFGCFAFLFYFYNIEMNVVILSSIVSVICGIILAFVLFLFKNNEKNLLNNVD